MGESLGSKISTGSEASPNAKATGTRIASNKKKPPKRTNAAIDGTFPHSLGTAVPAEQAANRAYARAWAERLAVARTDCLDPFGS